MAADYDRTPGGERFAPGAWASVLAVLGFAVFCALGLWQLDRAHEKRQLQAELRIRSQQAPLLLGQAVVEAARVRYLPLTVRGHFEPEREFLLANQAHQGHPGFHVITPLAIEGGPMHVLVDRGWVAQRFDGIDPQVSPPPAGEVSIQGHAAVPAPGVLGSGPGDARVQIAIDLEQLAARWQVPLHPVLLRMDPASDGGLPRDWQPVQLHPERSTGYAFQWFAMALASLVAWFFYGVRRARGTAE
ncbi:MAG: SURF1 family protein [Gammaproteobacteria bacterium]|nr:SURF1 family protein [Gammaproteobacteria bacterium]